MKAQEAFISIFKFGVCAVIATLCIKSIDVNVNHTFIDKHFDYSNQPKRNKLNLHIDDTYLKVRMEK